MPLTSESRRSIPARISQATEPALAVSRAGGRGAAGRSQERHGRAADASLVASLRQSLAEKEKALQRASLTAFQLQKRLDQAAAQNQTLQRQAQGTVSGNSTAIEGWGATPAATSGVLAKRRNRGVAGDKGPRLPESALAEMARERSREIRTRLVAGALPAAVVAVIWGIWSQMPQRDFLKNAQPVPVAGGAQTRRLQAEPASGKVIPGKAGSGNGSSGNSSSGGGDARAGGRFNQALNRLNDVLAYSPAPAEQLLKAARQRGLSLHRNVCDFSWNGGQPALLYHEGHLIYTQLDDCASAVESYIYGQ